LTPHRMEQTYLEHPSEEILERFALSQSSDEELDVTETHILACETCVTRLESLEIQIAATRLALQEIHKDEVARAYARQNTTWRNWLTMPRLSLLGAAAALALVLSVAPRTLFLHAPVAQVSLTAYRGIESAAVPKNHPLHVRLNANDLDQQTVNVALVDERGSQVWEGAARVQQNEVDVNVPGISEGGAHFFRLYAPQSNGEAELLREFSFQVK
jgi:hypothetical protein